MKLRVRVRELKMGDIFESFNLVYKVTRVTETEVTYYFYNLNHEKVESGRKTKGRNSMEFVYWVIPEEKKIEPVQKWAFTKHSGWYVRRSKQLKTA